MKVKDKVSEPMDLYEVTNGMTPAEIGGAVELSSTAASAAGALMAKIKNNTEDAVVFVSSDSTGTATNEWVYLYAEWLASLNSEYTVNYYKWDGGSGDYDPVVEIQAGTGSNTITIYNAAIAGSKITHVTGSDYENAIGVIPFIDLIIINHGHNHITQYASGVEDIEFARTKQFHDALSVFQRKSQNAGVIVLTQNPRRDDDNYSIMNATLNKFAESIGADIADSYSGFIERNKNPDLYADNIHPNSAGTKIYLNAVKSRHHSTASRGVNLSVLQSSKNILPNGGFELFGGAVPDSWSSYNATTTKELSVTRSLNGYSVKIDKTSGGSASRIFQNASSDLLNHAKGRFITMTVDMYIPDGSADRCGRLALQTNSNTGNITAPSSDAQGGWITRSISVFVDPSDTYITFTVYSDSGTSPSSTLYVDSVTVVVGSYPFSINA